MSDVKTVKTRIRLKNNTSAGWQSKNPVLLKGEFGFNTDSKYVKIGDGATAWNDLPTVRLPVSAIDGMAPGANTQYDIRIDAPGSKFTLLSSADGTTWGDVRSFTCKDFGPEISAALASAKAFAGEVAEDAAALALGQAKAYADSLDEAMGYRVDTLDDQVSAIQSDYLTSADKDELRGEINGKLDISGDYLTSFDKAEIRDEISAEADRALDAESLLGAQISDETDRAVRAEGLVSADVTAETARAKNAEELNSAAIAAVSSDYLKSADKAELSGAISAANAAIAFVSADYLKASDKAEIEDRISDLSGDYITTKSTVANVSSDYLKASDKTELEGKISDANAAIADVSSDYLKASDKAELQGDISDVAYDLSVISADYLKSADKTELEGKISDANAAIADVSSDYLKASDKAELSGAISAANDKISDIETVTIPTAVRDLSAEISSEAKRAFDSENAISGDLSNEISRAKGVEDALSTAIGNVPTSAAVEDLSARVLSVENLIPDAANEGNKLADKDFVNSSIATNTATFLGTYGTSAEISTLEADANDYAFLSSVDSEGNTKFDRFKYSATEAWMYEYTLNNSSFTAAQWTAINSNATSAKIALIDTNAGAIADLQTGKADKATTLSGYGIADAYTKSDVDAMVDKIDDDVSDLMSRTDAVEGDYLSRKDGGVVKGQLKAQTSVKVIDSNQAAGLVGAAQTTVTVGLDGISRDYTPAPTAGQGEATSFTYQYPAANGTIALTSDVSAAVQNKADKATTLSGYGITDSYTKTEADSAITAAIADKADKATTLSGYGIADAYTKTETDSAITTAVSCSAPEAATSKTLTAVSNGDNGISFAFSDISITHGQVSDWGAEVSAIAGAATSELKSTHRLDDLKAMAYLSSVAAANVDDGAVTTAKIANSAVTGDKIADANVTTAKIADANVTVSKLADSAVTTAKITDANITTAKIADNAITADKLATGSVTNAKLDAGAVTEAKIADANVSTDKLADSAVTEAKIAANAVVEAKISNGSVTSAKLADNAVVTAKITDSNVTTAKLATGAVTNVKLADNAVTTAKITDANVTEAKIADSAVTTAKIDDGAVTQAKIDSTYRQALINALSAIDATSTHDDVLAALLALKAVI